MITYHAATSEGLHANRIARLFWPSHPSHAAEDQRVDLRSESLAPDEAPTGKPTHTIPRTAALEHPADA